MVLEQLCSVSRRSFTPVTLNAPSRRTQPMIDPTLSLPLTKPPFDYDTAIGGLQWYGTVTKSSARSPFARLETDARDRVQPALEDGSADRRACELSPGLRRSRPEALHGAPSSAPSRQLRLNQALALTLLSRPTVAVAAAMDEGV